MLANDTQQVSAEPMKIDSKPHPTLHKNIRVDGLNIFYREAGSKDAPTILLLHGYKRDLKNLEFHLLDTGHFALEEDDRAIANLMRKFLTTNVLSVPETE